MRNRRVGSPDRFSQLLGPLMQGYLNYIKICEARINALDRSAEKDSSKWSTDCEEEEEENEELSLLVKNLRLYKFHANNLTSLQAKYQKLQANMAIKEKHHLNHCFGSNIDLTNSIASCYYGSSLELSHPYPLHNNFKGSTHFLICNTDLANMAAIQAEMMGMVGRLHFEVKAIIGFARITSGDVFEITIKHGSQRWKSKGKTQADKTQKWEQTTVVLDCLGDSPVLIKVIEVKFFKSRCLNERSFDPVKFFSHQPQLVTMNLNSIGSMKLQLIVTWLPLLSSKNVLHSKAVSASHLMRVQSKVGDIQMPYNSNSLPRSKSLGVEARNGIASPLATSTIIHSKADELDSSPKICLRDKKRERQLSSTSTIDKDRWRSSTTILDSVYKDLSKSILTIDDLSVLSSSRTNLHSSNASESNTNERRLKRNSFKEEYAFLSKQTLPASITPSLGKENQPVDKETSQKGGIRKTKLSSLKKNRNTSDKPSAPVDMTRSFSEHRSGSSNQLFGGDVQLASTASMSTPASLNPSMLNAQQQKWIKKTEPMKRVDTILLLIDELRSLLGAVRSAEHPELVGFEACMLNWEAVLKLNRASFLDENRVIMRRAGSSIRGLNKRASLYAQHSPSTASDEPDDNVIMNGGDSQVSENDSGIDSLRQHISPYYNTQQNSQQPVVQSSSAYTGMAQRRFKQFKERRKSLGIVLDGVPNGDYERLVLSSLEPWDHNQEPAANSCSFATGHPEIDDCLSHHLNRAVDSLKVISTSQGTPFEFTLTEMLSRMEQDTVALEMLLNVADYLPNLPNINGFLSELRAGNDVRDIWVPACSQVKFAILTTEIIQQRMHIFLQPIVEARYPKLVSNVLQALMGLLCQGWDPSKVSVFQFVNLFRGKHLSSFVENLSHEAWITSNLLSSQPNAVREVMNRLRNVPVVPPLESLRHMALVLAKEPPNVAMAVEKYLKSTSNELANDLSACFMCLLEHEDEMSKCGSCRALAFLKQENALTHLEYLAKQDKSLQVQSEAKKAFKEIRSYYNSYQEITKI